MTEQKRELSDIDCIISSIPIQPKIYTLSHIISARRAIIQWLVLTKFKGTLDKIIEQCAYLPFCCEEKHIRDVITFTLLQLYEEGVIIASFAPESSERSLHTLEWEAEKADRMPRQGLVYLL